VRATSFILFSYLFLPARHPPPPSPSSYSSFSKSRSFQKVFNCDRHVPTTRFAVKNFSLPSLLSLVRPPGPSEFLFPRPSERQLTGPPGHEEGISLANVAFIKPPRDRVPVSLARSNVSSFPTGFPSASSLGAVQVCLDTKNGSFSPESSLRDLSAFPLFPLSLSRDPPDPLRYLLIELSSLNVLNRPTSRTGSVDPHL